MTFPANAIPASRQAKEAAVLLAHCPRLKITERHLMPFVAHTLLLWIALETSANREQGLQRLSQRATRGLTTCTKAAAEAQDLLQLQPLASWQ